MSKPSSAAPFAQQAMNIAVAHVQPSILPNLVPLLLLLTLAGLVDHLLVSAIHPIARTLWWLAIQSLVVARYLGGALQGQALADVWDLNFSWRTVPPLALRFALASLIWGIPASLLFWIADPLQSLQEMLRSLLAGMVSLRNVGLLMGGNPERILDQLGATLASGKVLPDWRVGVLFVLSSLALVGPALSAVAAATSTQAKDLIQFRFWSRLVLDHWPSLLALGVALGGGIFLAFLLYLPLLGMGALLALPVSVTLSKLTASLALALPLSSWPILVGRLAGTLALATFPPQQGEPHELR